MRRRLAMALLLWGLGGPAAAQVPALLDEGPACRVLVVGDSMAQQIQGPLNRALRAAGVGQAYGAGVPATGLARFDYTERTNGEHWLQRAARLLGRALRQGEPFAAMLVFIGTNDRQDIGFLAEAGQPRRRDIHWGTPGYAAEYANRARGLADLARGHGATLVWLGMPRTGQRRHDAGMQAINGFVRAALAPPAQVWEGPLEDSLFLDLAAVTETAEGRYDAHLFDGQLHAARLRGVDGIHFTEAGNRLLAAWVAAQLGPVLAERAAAERCGQP